MLNNVSLIGRMVANPELKKTNSDISVLQFSIAVDDNYAKKGEEKKTNFIELIAWRNTADFISNYFKKGDFIAITGQLSQQTWTDKESGKNRSVLKVQVENAFFCGGKKETSATEEAPTNNTTSSEASDPNFVEPDDEDLPF